MSCHTKRTRRSGAAAVEFAVAMSMILVPMMIGLWEMGRLIMVQQIISTSAREGARLAAQAVTVNQNGTRTQIVTAIDPASNTLKLPNVKSAVHHTLYGSGLRQLNWADIAVAFTFLDSPTGALAGATEPYHGVKGQRFRVDVSIDGDAYKKLQWTSFGFVNPAKVSYSAEWVILSDDPFNINTTIPNL